MPVRPCTERALERAAEVRGGPGQIAIHGVANLTGKLGCAIFHGASDSTTQSIGWMAARIAPGVLVTITS